MDISEGLARVACAGEINGEEVDLRTVVDSDCELNILTFDSEGGKRCIPPHCFPISWLRPSNVCIRRLNWHRTFIKDGFYYDVDRETPFTSEDLEKIEAEMKKIVKEALPLERFTMTREEAIKFMQEKEEPYKVQLIEDLPEDAELSFFIVRASLWTSVQDRTS